MNKYKIWSEVYYITEAETDKEALENFYDEEGVVNGIIMENAEIIEKDKI